MAQDAEYATYGAPPDSSQPNGAAMQTELPPADHDAVRAMLHADAEHWSQVILTASRHDAATAREALEDTRAELDALDGGDLEAIRSLRQRLLEATGRALEDGIDAHYLDAADALGRVQAFAGAVIRLDAVGVR